MNARVIVLHATKRAAKGLGLAPVRGEVPAGTSRLGNWYVKLIEWEGRPFYFFTSARSLLCVIVPSDQPDILSMFVVRVGNLLLMLDVPQEKVERELTHFRDLTIAPARNFSVMTSMSDMALTAKHLLRKGPHPVSLSLLELELTGIPMGAIGTGGRLEYPRHMALELMGVGREWVM